MTAHLPDLPPGGNSFDQVSIAEAARRLSYGKRTLYRLVQTGEMPSVGEGRLRRIRVADIQAWQERHRKGGR